MAGEPILIIDDNPINLKLAKLILGASGLEIRTAADAEDALAVLESFSPRMILMDIQLPGMNGLDLTRKLKSDPAHRGIIIIALSASAMESEVREALSAGCDAFISKPFDPQALPKVIAEHLARGSTPTN